MGENTSATVVCFPLLGDMQAAYDQHRYLDVWQATSIYWQPSTDVSQLSAAELIFAGRMALRLGGLRLARSLFRRARAIAPNDPQVRYFTEHLFVPGELLLDNLSAFEACPDLGGDDSEARANWIALHATIWARLRNMPRALDLMRQAHALLPDNAWLYSQEADIWGIGDDWATSLRVAEQACSLDPRSSWAIGSLANALMNQGQIEQAVERVTVAAADTQSADLLRVACWYQCAWTELLEGEERTSSLAKARVLAAGIAPLSPLADKECKASMARVWLDIAMLGDDRNEMERWASEVRSPFHRRVLANLKENPGGRRIRLPYRRTLQKHAECVPTSISSALSASNIDLSITDFAADVTFGGTAEWAAADWLRQQNLHVRFFSATAETTWRLLSAGIAFMVTWPDDDGGHAVAIVGMDQAAGIVLAHDPTSLRTTEYLLTAFDGGGSTAGVLALAAVGMERAAELDSLLPDDSAIIEAAQAQQKALTLYGPSAAQASIRDISMRFPDHPAIHELIAIQDLEEGRTGQALSGFRELLQQFPRDPRLRSNLIIASRALGNTALQRQTLKTIVETGVIAGEQAEANWIRPHPRYVTEYADLLRTSAATRHEAEILLRSALRTNWSFAQAWHVLADLRWDQRRTNDALLAYSIASFLAPHNEHYARAYVDVLLHEGRAEDGLAWLQDRVHRLGRSLQGVSAWTTWISVLEERGYPERALAAYTQATEQHGSSVALLGFAVQFLARMARWDESRAQLDALALTEGRATFHEAAVALHQLLGEPEVALEHANAWVSELPRSMSARYAALSLIRTLNGTSTAAAVAETWMREHPANEDFEGAFSQYAQDGRSWRKLRMLKMRLKRNAEDGWAWRELIFAALAMYDTADLPRRQRMAPRIEAWFREAARVSPNDAAFLRAKALWQENCGHWRAAVDGYVEAIRMEPEHFFGYRRAWDCAARLPDSERRELWAVLEPLYIEVAGRLPNAAEMVGLLAGRFGVPETEGIVARCRERRPDDPNVLEAAADLLLDHGRGKSASERALELLQDAVARFPDHGGLRFSLARALRAVGDDAQAHSVYRQLLERRPNDLSAQINVAWIEHREGNTARALETLERASRQAPHDPRPLDERAQILIDSGRHEEALALVEHTMQSIPDSVQTYEYAIARFRQCGQMARAVEAARQGTVAFPRGAYLWLLLGKTLKEAPEFAAAGEMEACLRLSLTYNATLYESADWLTIFLLEQHRYEDASALLREMEPRLPDPSAALGRLAWIKRQSGEKAQAVADLAEVVRQAPWYGWGWNRLLSWLTEDKDWQQAKNLLGTIPPVMLSNTEFRNGRLALLAKAGVEASVIDEEWDALLRDFPENATLHMHRFDALGAKRLPEAAEVLRRVLPAGTDNVYLLARLVEVHCFEKDFPAATDNALAICFAKIEESVWPANHAWEQIRKVGLIEDFVARFRSRLKQGDRPTSRALSLYAEDLLGRNTQAPKWFRQSWLNPHTLRVHAFVRLVQRSAWMQPDQMGNLMEALNKSGYRRMAFACWRHLKAKGQDTDTFAWAQAGNALINLKRKRSARTLMQDWRTRKGVQMWMLANYLLALPRLTQAGRAEVIATCEDGLAKLAHDHCAYFLTYMAAETYIFNCDRPGLLKLWESQARYFDGTPAKGDFFPQWQRYLIHDVPVAVRISSEPHQPGYNRLLFGMWTRRMWNPSTRARLRQILVLLFRVILIAAASGGALRELFR